MPLSSREENILEAVVRGYTVSAAPISSRRILETERFSCSSATIRAALAALEEQGYLKHPHTSAGRIPTVKGYRYFVDHLMDESPLPMRIRERFENAETFRDIIKMAAELTHLFTIVDLSREDTFFNFGFSELLHEPEFQDKELVARFGDLFDAMYEQRNRYTEAIGEDGFGVFIGGENPVPEARCGSVVASLLPDGGGCLLAIGPVRMDYERARNVLKISAYMLTKNRYE